MATSKDIESRTIEAEEERTYSRAVFVENLKDFMAQSECGDLNSIILLQNQAIEQF